MNYTLIFIIGFVLIAAGVLIKGVMGQIFALAGLIVEFFLVLYLMIASFMKWDISAKKEIFIPLDAGHIPTEGDIGVHRLSHRPRPKDRYRRLHWSQDFVMG